MIVLRLGCSVSGSQAQVWIDCPTDEEKKRKRTPRTTTIPSWASGSCRLKTAVLDGVTVFQCPTPARTQVGCTLYAVPDAARVTGDWRYLPAHSACIMYFASLNRPERSSRIHHRPVPAPASWVPVSELREEAPIYYCTWPHLHITVPLSERFELYPWTCEQQEQFAREARRFNLSVRVHGSGSGMCRTHSDSDSGVPLLVHRSS